MKLQSCLRIARNALLSDFEYRINYFLVILSGAITVVMEVAIFNQIYAGRDQVGFLPREMALSFVVMGMFLRHAMSDWSVTQEMIGEIREGTFRRFLLQPLHFPTFLFAYLSGAKSFSWAISLVAILIFKMFPAFNALLPSGFIAMTALSFIFAIVLSWQIYLVMLFIGFWIHEAGFLMMAFNIGVGVFSGSLLPLDWLHPVLQKLIALTPLPLLGDIPVRTSLGLISQSEWVGSMGQGALWFCILAVLNGFLWRFGTKHYEAFGG